MIRTSSISRIDIPLPPLKPLQFSITAGWENKGELRFNKQSTWLIYGKSKPLGIVLVEAQTLDLVIVFRGALRGISSFRVQLSDYTKQSGYLSPNLRHNVNTEILTAYKRFLEEVTSFQ